MFRLLIVPIVIGILLALFIYFIVPEIVSETDIVSYFARTILDLSNSYFAHMPHVVASYIANLNLLIVAITAGLLLTVIIQLLVLIADTLIFITKWIIHLLKRNRKKVEVKDLPPVDLESRFRGSPRGKNILGGGFDTIDRD